LSKQYCELDECICGRCIPRDILQAETVAALLLKERAGVHLRLYLLSHEEDIAACINDFGGLNSVFQHIMKREPEG